MNNSFFLCFVKTRKKLDKYFKVNRIRNKIVIDIRKLMEEEKIDKNNKDSVSFFKILIWNKIRTAQEKNKDIYYIPNFQNPKLKVKGLIELDTSLRKYYDDFNLLLFFDEFVGTNWLDDILINIDSFDNSQILEDY